MTALLVLSTALALALIILSVSEAGGVPVSLSSTYYEMGGDGWLFQLLLASAAVSLLPVWLAFSTPGHEWMAFLACASLMFVAAAPAFRLELQGKVHYTAAALCCVCAAWWQIAEGLWDTLLFLSFIALTLVIRDRSKWCWWLECAVTGSVYLNLIRETIVKL